MPVFPGPVFRLFLCVCLSLLFCGRSYAVCTPGTSWIASWSDACTPSPQTTYKLEAPCKVYINTPFSITATVTDNTYPDSGVGLGWIIEDTGVTSNIVNTVASGSWITVVGGQWQKVYQITYTGTPENHTLQFSFNDLGCPVSAHSLSSGVASGLTVDPYPQSYYPVRRLFGGGYADYDLTPANAYAKVDSDDQVIECRTGDYGDVLFDQAYSLLLEGGFDQNFTVNADSFSDIASVTISSGTVTIENITIQ